MIFNHDFIEKVRDANNLVDVISEYTQLKRTADRHMGRCPFPSHIEKTPSFSVSESKQVYHCFGCKKSGDIFSFLQEMRGFSFPEVVEYLADKSGIEIPKESKSQDKNTHAKELRKKMWKLNQLATEYFHHNLLKLPANDPIREYCKSRGLTEEIIKAFEIGVGKDEWEDLCTFLSQKKAPLEMAAKLGLVKKRPPGKQGFYDVFRSRLVFPIVSHTGNYIGFGGRIIGEGQPKYLNSPESEIFNKGHIFYGLNETAKFIRSQDQVILVEGYMDLLALYVSGFKNVVATLGTALTKDHARLLKRYTKNVVVLFDGDKAGQNASERSLPILLAEGLFPRGLILPDNLDPDDFLQQRGKEALDSSIQSAPELFQVILESNFENYHGNATEKVAIMDQMAPILKSVSDSRLLQLYIEEMALKLDVKSSWIKSALEDKARSKFKNTQEPAPVTQTTAPHVLPNEGIIKLERPPKAEIYLVNLVLLSEEILKRVIESAVVGELSHSGVIKIFDIIQREYGQNPNKFDKLTSCLVSRVSPPKWVSMHLTKLFSEMDTQGIEKMYMDCHRQIRRSYMRAKTKELAAHLKTVSSSDQQKKLEQIMNIHKDRQNLNRDS